MLHKTLSIVLLILGASLSLQLSYGQATPPPVSSLRSERGSYAYPWAGGMNACQFGQVDIDLDGTSDLVVFDRCGNRLMPFHVSDPGGYPDYNYAPEFGDHFPELSDWVIFADYNGDDKVDIFTYSPGYAGMKVYRNISGSKLEFELAVFPYLASFQGGGYVNILVTYADYPAIADLDGDGDLDILTFRGLGSFVEMHRNMSVEKYGNLDSLDFIKTETCWGYFAESEESNEVTLDTCYGIEAWKQGGMGAWKQGSREEGLARSMDDLRHTGSTFLVLDLNGDGLLDLLLGDVDYPNLVALYNGGNPDTARMISYDWEFPAYDTPVQLFSMPSAYSGDINLDGVRDLIASPFDPNPYICGNINTAWFYRNDGSDQDPDFKLVNKRFLQEEMIDLGAGAYPVFADYNHDGLMDLFVGNYGRYDTSYYDPYPILHSEHTGQIALFINSGKAGQPAFTFITDDFAGVSQLDILGAVPSFADLDGDEDQDMLLGNHEGQLFYFENIAQAGQPMEMTLRENQYQGIDVGYFSAPALFDLDDDGLPDLVIGEKGGNLNFYKNIGSSSNPVFDLVTDSLGKVNVTDPNVSLDGYSVPFLLLDGKGHMQLLVGSEQGKIYYYADIEEDLNGSFKESGELGALIGLADFRTDRGFRSSGALADLNQDGVYELVAGNFGGGLEFFCSMEPPAVHGIKETPDVDEVIKVYPNPAVDYIIIACTDPTKYEIVSIKLCDMTGRILLQSSVCNRMHNPLNLRELGCGIYFFDITLREIATNSHFSYLKKMLKKNKSR